MMPRFPRDLAVQLSFDGAVRRVVMDVSPRITGERSAPEALDVLTDGSPTSGATAIAAGLGHGFPDFKAIRDAEDRLHRSEERYRRLFEAMDEGCLLAEAMDGSDAGSLLISAANPAAQRLLHRDLKGRRLSKTDGALDGLWWELADQVLRTGDSARQELWEASVNLWFKVSASRLDGKRVTILFQDITPGKRHADERELMVGELNHRVKNMLAVVQSIARQTLRSTDHPEAFAAAISHRLEALTCAHGLLTHDDWGGVDLRALALAILRDFSAGDAPRFDIDGPPARLSPNATISFALALHELATNALKHGALSSPDGRVVLRWVWDGDGHDRYVRFSWNESGGPPVAPPTHVGFGGRLLKGVARELSGAISVGYPAEGFTCTVDFPAGKVVSDGRA